MRVLTCYNNAMYPGIAKLVSRLVWDQETVRSSRTTRTKKIFPLLYGRGKIFYSIVSIGNGFMFPTHWCKNAEAWFRFRLSWIFWL